VKIRGFRIEPGEIESVLTQHSGIAEAVVVVREDTPGDRRLVAYVVTAAGGGVVIDEVREWVKARLPEYMVPASVMVLDGLPVTGNGKLDRRALPVPEYVSEVGYVAARNPTEEALAEIWADVLGATRAGVHDNFFDLGGNSILSLQIVESIQLEFGIDLPVRVFFDSPTIAALADAVEEQILLDIESALALESGEDDAFEG
jgi:acyl carrier protein